MAYGKKKQIKSKDSASVWGSSAPKFLSHRSPHINVAPCIVCRFIKIFGKLLPPRQLKPFRVVALCCLGAPKLRGQRRWDVLQHNGVCPHNAQQLTADLSKSSADGAAAVLVAATSSAVSAAANEIAAANRDGDMTSSPLAVACFLMGSDAPSLQ